MSAGIESVAQAEPAPIVRSATLKVCATFKDDGSRVWFMVGADGGRHVIAYQLATVRGVLALWLLCPVGSA